MVGLYAEPLPKGFGFSDTAFRVFILMASRRLKSDRFFTRDYNAETYTQTGLDWIDETSMSDVLLRHYPELEPALRGVDNAFAPWTRVTPVRELAPGVHILGGQEGRPRPLVPARDERRADARRHALRGRRPRRARRRSARSAASRPT